MAVGWRDCGRGVRCSSAAGGQVYNDLVAIGFPRRKSIAGSAITPEGCSCVGRVIQCAVAIDVEGARSSTGNRKAQVDLRY